MNREISLSLSYRFSGGFVIIVVLLFFWVEAKEQQETWDPERAFRWSMRELRELQESREEKELPWH